MLDSSLSLLAASCIALAACGGRISSGEGAPDPTPSPAPSPNPSASPSPSPNPGPSPSTLPRGFFETKVTVNESIGLFAVWAASPTAAWASGWPSSYGGETPALHWDGKAWTQVHPQAAHP